MNFYAYNELPGTNARAGARHAAGHAVIMARGLPPARYCCCRDDYARHARLPFPRARALIITTQQLQCAQKLSPAFIARRRVIADIHITRVMPHV